MPHSLDPIELRVLGCLAEKDLATPEYYPLSLNALVNACNQKTNRDPVVHYDEASIYAALSSLEQAGLADSVLESGSRVEKYGHRLAEVFNFTRGEQAVLAVLLLRGPQTPGELRQRADRLHAFPDIDSVLHTLNRLSERQPDPLVCQLQRLPGMKESRWAHLLGALPPDQPQPHSATPATPVEERLRQLEAEVATLREELAGLRRAIDALASR